MRKGVKDNEEISRKRMKRWKTQSLWTFLAILSVASSPGSLTHSQWYNSSDTTGDLDLVEEDKEEEKVLSLTTSITLMSMSKV